MSYKKYSPFLKSIKILMLLSFMYFTTRLDAVDLHIPVTMEKFEYGKLPVYCKASTKHFECKHDNGDVYCLPESLKCRVKCANDAELNCEHSATTCPTGQVECKRNGTSPIRCIADEQLCDGHLHCPLKDDEDLEMCKRRTCSSTQFACQSPGHCIADSHRCDGQHDCKRPGLDDKSDEMNCRDKHLSLSVCASNQFACKDGQKCIESNYKCDGFSDCDDNSDEADCSLKCRANEFMCDNRCMKETLRCDGKADCSKGEDEQNCPSKKCSFNSEFSCRVGDKCVSQIFVCDGTDDCGTGYDEVCPIANIYCSSERYWTCKSGSYCILAKNRCDSKPHCPDGSDEFDCPTKVPPPAPVVCELGHHLCNGTKTCVDIMAACSGRAFCPQPDSQLDAVCRKLHKTHSPCADSNGGCEHLCQTSMNSTSPVASCACRPGYQVAPDDARKCIDVDECKRFGSCDQVCSNTVGSYSCSCLPGYRAHGSNCLAHGAAKLLYSTNSDIEYLDLETGSRVNVLSGLHYPKYLAYSNENRRIFYLSRDGILGSVRLDGTEHKVILRSLAADAIAYDWTRHLLFYAVPKMNDISGHIGVIDVATGRRAVLRVLDCPRGLAVHPRKFALYFTLRCSQPNGVYTMAMDGSDFSLLFGIGGMPGHLAIDVAQKPERLYWTDSYRNGVYSGTVDGDDPRVHMHRLLPFDLSPFQNQLYFTVLNEDSLYSANKFLSDPSIEKKLSGPSFLSVVVYHSLLQPAGDPLPKCDCSHICLARPRGTPSCLCDVNYRLKPGTPFCVNGTEPAVPADTADVQTDAPLASQDQTQEAPAEGRVGSIAGIVIGTLCVCLIIGVSVAMYCLRIQDRQSVNLGGDIPHGKEVGSIPKVDSRTPLTDCEVGVDSKL